nr:hypothetical protein [uncultured Campylobacter sp.]
MALPRVNFKLRDGQNVDANFNYVVGKTRTKILTTWPGKILT